MLVKRQSSIFRNDLQMRQLLSNALLLLGAVLVLVVVSSYGWMIIRQQELASEWSPIPDQTTVSGSSLRARSEPSGSFLAIPKIGLHAAVLEGTNRKSLLLAPGHLKGTPWPGDPGNAVIAAHRDTFFRQLVQVGLGDDIFVLRNGTRYHYVVTGKSIVEANDVAVTAQTAESRLTLITCYPTYYIGPAPKRLVVVSELESGAARLSENRIR